MASVFDTPVPSAPGEELAIIAMADFESIGDIVARLIPLLGEPLPDIYSEPARTEDDEDATADDVEGAA